jgi:hypothetical protein
MCNQAKHIFDPSQPTWITYSCHCISAITSTVLGV